MENLEDNIPMPQEEPVVKVNRKAFSKNEPILTELEASIQSRRNDLNFPALQSMFGLTEAELQAILDKLPAPDNCNC